MHPYVKGTIEKITQATEEQEDKLIELSKILANCVKNDGVLHVLGTGHSHMISEELFYRAGGALFVNPILEPNLMLHESPVKSTRLERLPGYATAILDGVEFKPNDVFLIISNSGRNSVPVEAAYYAKERGIFTVSITSLAHSRSVESRHESGKMLYEITDLTLDNYGEIGDTLLQLDDFGDRYGATSSAVGVVLVQTLMSMTIERLASEGIRPPLMSSANLDHVDEANIALVEKYKDRIGLLK